MQYLQPTEACQPKLRTWVDERLDRLATVLWPSICMLCGDQSRRGLDLCTDCEADLPQLGPACSVCALPMPVHTPTCGTCMRHRPAFQTSVIPFRYAWPLDRVIQAFKYGGQAHCGRVLGTLLADHLRETRKEDWPQLLLPMPLATRRYRERGFNQAIELALAFRGSKELEVRTDLVVRRRETLEQARLDRKARRRNVRNAFELVRSLPATHVAILDDVVTTASTVNELARVLRRAGAKRVEVWAIARAGEKRLGDFSRINSAAKATPFASGYRKMKSSAMPMNTAMPK